MKYIENSPKSIGFNYPENTGRLKHVTGGLGEPSKKVALLGDSTLDNGYWVEQTKPYIQKSHTVTHQTAVALAGNNPSTSFDIANFAVDGATTQDLLDFCQLNKVLRDEDHPTRLVHQLKSVASWKPDVAVLSVAGNNYRVALAKTLGQQMNYPQLLLRITPERAKHVIRQAFQDVKTQILEDYKKIIDELIEGNPHLNRIVLMSQYYPEITEFTYYFIYTGFSHLARSEEKGKTPFTAVEETMNELYREILDYAATKKKEIVFVDVTSSLNPLGGKHSRQIEPNEQGSIIMGRLIAGAVTYEFPELEVDQEDYPIARIYMDADEREVCSQLLMKKERDTFSVKKIEQFISENRYRHLNLFFAPESSLSLRYKSAWHAIMGDQFDTEYTGLFAFGLLDLSVVTVMASYLWRVAINEQVPDALRAIVGIVAAPVLLAKMTLGLTLMLVLALPILGYDKAINHFSGLDTIQDQEELFAEEDALIPAL